MKYFKKVLKLIYDNKSFIPIYILAAYCFAVFAIFLKEEHINSDRLFAALGYLFLCTALLAVSLLIKDGERKWMKRYAIWINGFFLLLSPAISFIMVEIMVGNYSLDMFKNYGFYNLIWYMVIYYMIFALTMDVRITIKTGNIFIYLLSMVNYFVYMFRGNPLIPSDLLVWRTGMSVADNYKISFTKDFLTATLIMTALFALAHMLEGRKSKAELKVKIIALGSYGAILCLVFYWFFGTDLIKSKIQVIDFFAPKYTTCSYGTAFAFVANIDAMSVESPDGYSRQKVEEILSSVAEVPDEKSEGQEDDTQTDFHEGEDGVQSDNPDLIVIMNEAFSDLSLIGDYKTNIDYLPNIRALDKDVIKGVLYVSVFGGATSDTEYEFLTGNSMAVMPPNSVPYQQFVTEPTDSLAATLKEQGYYNIAIHPYNPTGYKRDLVYPLLGFDEFISESDFLNPQTIRGFISDRESYLRIIKEYEVNKEKGPLFFFNVTMQNHGGYSSDQIFSEEETVRLVDYPQLSYVDQYLSLLRESDKAFKELTDYFKKQERHVIILLFGDHQPIAYSGLYDLMPNQDMTDELKYKVPFVIWANYDMEEDYIDAMSANYLSSYLLKIADLKGTVYSKYLMQLYEEIPVINALFYMDKENRLYSLSEESPYKETIEDYKYIGYNNALDKRNKLDEYFYLNEDKQ